MMRALVFTHHYPSQHWPSRATYSESAYVALSRYCDLRVVVPVRWWHRLRWPGELFTIPSERTTGLEVTLPTFWSLPAVHEMHAAHIVSSLRDHVRAIRREFPFDAMLSAWAYPDAVAAATLALELDVPLVTTVLGSDVNETPNHPALLPQIRWGLGRARRVIAVSHALGERVAALGVPRERIVVQHNGVDGERFAIRAKVGVRATLGLPSDRPTIVYVGNLEPSKGVDFLIEAAPEVLRAVPGALFLIVGGGALAERLATRARELELGESVRFCGRLLHKEIPDYIAAGDLLVLPSRREGCPNVVLEALASGRPVVAARVGGVPELISQANGSLVEPESPPALARALIETLGRDWNPAALRSTLPALSWDVVARRYRDVLTDVLAETRKRAA